MTDDELELALTFAKLEIIEVQAKRRSLTACPGIKQVAQAIKEAEEKAAKES